MTQHLQRNVARRGGNGSWGERDGLEDTNGGAPDLSRRGKRRKYGRGWVWGSNPDEDQQTKFRKKNLGAPQSKEKMDIFLISRGTQTGVTRGSIQGGGKSVGMNSRGGLRGEQRVRERNGHETKLICRRREEREWGARRQAQKKSQKSYPAGKKMSKDA